MSEVNFRDSGECHVKEDKGKEPPKKPPPPARPPTPQSGHMVS